MEKKQYTTNHQIFPPKDKLCLSVNQLAEVLGIGRVNAYELARSKGFPSISVKRRILIPIAGLDRWLEEQASK